jgi:hypothetical protein
VRLPPEDEKMTVRAEAAVCPECGANPCCGICPTQDPFCGDQEAEDRDYEFNARYDDMRERYADSSCGADNWDYDIEPGPIAPPRAPRPGEYWACDTEDPWIMVPPPAYDIGADDDIPF